MSSRYSTATLCVAMALLALGNAACVAALLLARSGAAPQHALAFTSLSLCCAGVAALATCWSPRRSA